MLQVYQEHEMKDQTFFNAEDNMLSLVTCIKGGFAVTLIDVDSENIVVTRIYPYNLGAEAVAYAKFLAQAI